MGGIAGIASAVCDVAPPARAGSCRESPLLDGVDAGASAYFVHGYAAPVTGDCIAACTHGTRFAAMVRRGNVAGAQFHPERSASVGARLLSNFLRWNGA